MEDVRPTIEISVRKLVEFVLASGDIDNRIGGVDPLKAMQEGTKAHQSIQRAAGPEYHAEVPFVYFEHYDEYDLKVSGRADGVIIPREISDKASETYKDSFFEDEKAMDDGQPEPDSLKGKSAKKHKKNSSIKKYDTAPAVVNVTIDEIKGVYLDLDMMNEPLPLHLAQAKCYAFFYSSDHDKCDMSVRMTYINLDNYKIKYFHFNFTYEELKAFFSHVLSLYKRWADFLFRWQKIRNESIQKLKFPYEFRAGQKELIAKIYYSISKEKLLFMQAPTGTGKTLATIFPSVKAVGNSLASKIFYLTAKNVTRNVAFNAFKILSENGLRMKSVMISAREKLCTNTEVKCDPDHCVYAKGHFDRINDAVYELLTSRDITGPEDIIEWAKEKNVCPYYLNLDLSRWCDNIVCDYNYVFDPNASLSQFFSEGIGQDFIFLIDEAHNLIERGRDMYSASFTKEEVLLIKKKINTGAFGIVSALNKLNREFLEIRNTFHDVMLEETGANDTNDSLSTQRTSIIKRGRKSTERNSLTSSAEDKYFESHAYFPDDQEITDFMNAVGRVVNAFQMILEKKIPLENEDEILEHYFNISFFYEIYVISDSHYKFYFSYDDEKNFHANLFCIDPSKNIQERLDMGISTVFFSATLLPMEYHKRLLCLEEKPFAVFAESTFPPENKRVFIGNDVTSLYKKRNSRTYSDYAAYIINIINSHEGNYMAFFPSYGFMKEVLNYFYSLYDGDYEILVQENGMKEQDKDAFLNTFENKNKVIAFTVSGGAFSEGIDLTGNSLIGVIICGAALPKYSIRQKMIEDYFKEKGVDGFSYAYLYPGMNKVLQAAGRVIRTETDKGIIVLLDSRFEYSSYRNIFPPDWAGQMDRCTKENVSEKIQAFWNSGELPKK